MRYIVAVDRTGVHVVPVHSSLSPYQQPQFIAEKIICTYGVEYVAAIYASTEEEAREAGLKTIHQHFPDALPPAEKE